MRKALGVTVVILALTLLAGCTLPFLPKKEPAKPATFEERAGQAITAIKGGDLKTLATIVHPTKGVRFSPYGNIRTGDSGDLVYTAAQLPEAMADTAVRRWGNFDGSGDPIDLTFAKYWARFVYDKDFAATPQVGFNKIIGIGNTLINMNEAYPGASFVEYYVPGTEKYGNMDWACLRLVFEQVDGVWYLVGIVHDQWTI